jgi:hypothetical protein
VQENSSFSKTAARVASIIFHPVFVPSLVYTFLLLLSPNFFLGVSAKTQSWWLIMIAYFTITFPLLVVFLLWRLKFIDSMQMHGLKERYGPLIASMLFYFWTFWTIHKQPNSPFLLQSFLLGVFLTTVFLFMVSIFNKISLHTGAWGSVLMFAVICAFHQIQFSLLLIILSLFIAGIVGTSRLYLKAHNNKQIYSAYVIGAAAQLVAYFICKLAFT